MIATRRNRAAHEASASRLYEFVRGLPASSFKTRLEVAFWNGLGIPIDRWATEATNAQKKKVIRG